MISEIFMVVLVAEMRAVVPPVRGRETLRATDVPNPDVAR
jgi:hypothetical protein